MDNPLYTLCCSVPHSITKPNWSKDLLAQCLRGTSTTNVTVAKVGEISKVLFSPEVLRLDAGEALSTGEVEGLATLMKPAV